ncbi:right-handed parallel beta-helix repeat-containing protein, partial [Candidatus Dependentiae bacterium]|nr:right-handed parallel beta-helix repeat-containing protein [Candidatus Dependentiae bacterium]
YNSNNGIFIDYSNNCTISNNISEYNNYRGIRLNVSEYNTVSNNLSQFNANYGIYLIESNNNTITDNISRYNSNIGIFLDTSSHNIITNNMVSNNKTVNGYGICVSSSDNNYFSQNTVDSNFNYGFYITGMSSADTFISNNFIPSPYFPDSAVLINTSNDTTYNFRNNYWSTADSSGLALKINGISGKVIWSPYRFSEIDTATGADTVAPNTMTITSYDTVLTQFIVIYFDTPVIDELGQSLNYDNNEHISGFHIFRALKNQLDVNEDTGDWYKFLYDTIIVSSGYKPNFYIDYSVSSGETYYYRVTAFDSHLNSGKKFYNESWYSNSMKVYHYGGIDTNQPNVWYINDTSVSGDSFCYAFGSSSNYGVSKFSPKRFLNDLEGFLTEGDTIYIDAGTYLENDTFVIDTNCISVIGVDSVSTIINFNNTTAQAARGIYALNKSNLYLKNIRVTNGRNNIWFNNVDSSVIDSVKLDGSVNGGSAMYLQNGASGNIISNCYIPSGAGYGFWISGSFNNIFQYNISSGNTNQAAFMMDNADSNLFTGNRASVSSDGFSLNNNSDSNYFYNNISETNTWDGFYLSASLNNKFVNNNIYSNGQYGFNMISSSDSNLISGNNICYNLSDGIMINTAISNNITDNLIYRNGIDGISMVFFSDMRIERNIIKNNAGYGIEFGSAGTNCYVFQNTFDSNANYQINYTAGSGDTFQKNVIIPSMHSPNMAVTSASASVINFEYNYWGTSDSSIIRNMIGGVQADKIDFVPYRTSKIDTSLNADTVAPASPVILNADSSVYGQVTLVWSKPVNEEEGGILTSGDTQIAGYTLYRFTQSDTNNWEPYLVNTFYNADDTNFTDNTVSSGETYYYKISAYDSHVYANQQFYNKSWYSNSFKVNTPQFYDTGSIKVYVSDLGNASNPASGDTATAFPSLAAALNLLNPNNGFDTIVVYSHSSDSYTVSDTLYLDTGMLIISKLFHSGYDEINDTKPKFFFNSGIRVIFKPGVRVGGFYFTGADSSNTDNILFAANSIAPEPLDNLYISNCDFVNFYKAVDFINASSNSNSIIKHCNFINCYYGVDGLYGNSKFFNNKFLNISSDAVKIYESDKVLNNYFKNVYNAVSYSIGSADTTFIVNNTFENISNNALNFTGGISIKVGIYNNLFLSCYSSVTSNSANDTYYFNNIFYDSLSTNLFNAVSLKNNYYDSLPAGNIYYGSGFSSITNETGICPENVDLDFDNSADNNNAVYYIGYFGDSNPFAARSNISPVANNLTLNGYTPNINLRFNKNDTFVLNWNYSDADLNPQTDIHLLIDNNSDFSSPEYDVSCRNDSQYYIVQTNNLRFGINYIKLGINDGVGDSIASYWNYYTSGTDSFIYVFQDTGSMIVYVSNSGDSSNPSKNDTSTAFNKIEYALNYLNPDNGYDTIYLFNGIYTETIYITDDTGLWIKGESRDATVINPSGDSSTPGLTGIYCNVTNVRFQYFTLTECGTGVHLFNSDNTRFDSIYVSYCGNSSNAGIIVQNSDTVYIVTTSFTNNYKALAFYGCKNSYTTLSVFDNNYYSILFDSYSSILNTDNFIIENIINNSFNTALNLISFNSGLLSSNWIQNNFGNALVLNNGETNILRFNTIKNNSGAGLHLQNGYSNIVLENMIIDGAGINGVGIYLANSGNNKIGYNKIQSNDSYAVYIGTNCSYDSVINNNIVNSDTGIFNASDNQFDFSYNYFGSTDTDRIYNRINGNYPHRISFVPFRFNELDTDLTYDTVVPAAIQITSISEDSGMVIIQWDTPAYNYDGSAITNNNTGWAGFHIFKSNVSGLNTNFDTANWYINVVYTADRDLRQWIDTDVLNGTNYVYRITVFDSHYNNSVLYNNESWYSDTKSIIPVENYNGPKWYVSSDTGNDLTGNGSETLPYQTIYKALSMVEPFDTVFIYNGIYAETVSIDTDNITLIGSDSVLTVIDPAGDSNTASLYGIYAQNRKNIYVRNFQIRDCGYGLYFDNSDTSVVSSCYFNVNGKTSNGGIYIASSDSVLIENCWFYNNYNGLYVSSGNYNVIRYNYVQKGEGRGFYLSSVSYSAVHDNISKYNSYDGYTIMGSNQNQIYNNIADNNSYYGFNFSTSSYNYFKNNNSKYNSAAGIYVNSNSNYNSFVSNNISENLTGTGFGFQINDSINNKFIQNTLNSNYSYGYYITGISSADTIEKNNWTGSPANPDSAVYNEVLYNFDFRNNYWNTSDSSVLSSKFKVLSGNVLWTPFRITEIDTLFSSDTVSPQTPSFAGYDTSVPGQLSIRWSKPVNDEYNNLLGLSDSDLSGYNLYRSRYSDTNNWENYIIASIHNPDDTQFIDSGLIIGETYYYRISSFDSHITNGKCFYNQSWYSNSYQIIYNSPELFVNINSPIDFYDTLQNIVYIQGTTLNSLIGDTVTIYTNSLENTYFVLNSANGNFSGTAVLTGYGDSITVKLSDKFGRTSYDTITVNYYQSISISVSYPVISNLSYDTIVQIINVSGTTYQTNYGDTVNIFCNGILNSVNTITSINGTFSGTAALNNQTETVYAVVTDRFNRNDTAYIIVNYFPSLSMELGYPENNHDTNQQNINISGTTYNSKSGDTVIIYVNGIFNSQISITGMNGSWTGTARVTAQSDSITAKVTDQFGRTYYDTITINYFGQPSVEISNLQTGYDTFTQIIYVSGTTFNTMTGDTLFIFVNSILQDSVTLSNNNGNWTGTAALTGINDTVIVTVYPRLNLSVSDSVVINYLSNPLVSITSPQNNYETMSLIITVSGTTINSQINDTVTIYVNGIANSQFSILSLNGNWTGTAVLTGHNDSLTVKFTDQFGRINYDTITVNYFVEPSIQIMSPQNNYDTIVQIIILSGTTYNTQINDTASIYVNGIFNSQFSILSLNGNWTGTAYLTGYNDSVTVKLTDRFGRNFYDTVVLNYFSTLNVKIISPENNYDTMNSLITVNGTTSNSLINDTVIIYVNGIVHSQFSILSLNGNWTGTGILANTGDTITVKLIDKFGRNSYDTIFANYFKTPSVEIVYPQNNFDTNVQTIIISGTTIESGTGDTVEVYVNSVFNSRFLISGFNGTWSCTASLTGNSDVITIKFTDRFNRIYYDTIFGNYYSHPSIFINNPVNSNFVCDTTVNQILVSGTTAWTNIGDTVFLYVNNVLNNIIPVTSLNSVFGGTVTLTNQSDTVFAVVQTKFGEYNTSSITVNYLPYLSFAITHPLNNNDTNIQDIIVSGTSYNSQSGDTVMIYVNGIFNSQILISGLNAVWTGTAHFTDQANTIVAEIKDRFSRIYSDTIFLNYFAGVLLEISAPQTGYDTLTQIIFVSGTTYNTKSGDTLWIYVNGIFQDSVTLANNNGAWNGTAKLTGVNNIISVTVYPELNENVNDSVTVNYLSYPSVLITNPLNNYDTMAAVIIVNGTSDNSQINDTVIIYVNGILNSQFSVLSLNGNWTGTASLTGYNDSLTVKFTDKFGRINYDTVTVNYFAEPSAGLTAPSDNLDTFVRSINLFGTTNNTRVNDTVTIYVNGIFNSEFSIINLNGDWTGTAELNGYNDSVTVKLSDRFGRNYYDTYIMNYYGELSVKILSPVNNSDTLISVITISGTTNNSKSNDTVTIYVNGIVNSQFSISSLNGTWNGTGALINYGDSITLKLTDKFDRSAYDTVSINYFGTPEIKITSPSDNYDTDYQVLSISGTTRESGNGDTVELFVNEILNSQYLINNLDGVWTGT